MDSVSVELTVFFEGPFYVGVVEHTCDGRLTASRTVFGAEPRDAEVLAWILGAYGSLTFSPAVEDAHRARAASPKRAKRDAGRRLAREGTGTKSQQALAAGREALKAERREAEHDRREQEAQRRFAQKQHKRKQKRRGR